MTDDTEFDEQWRESVRALFPRRRTDEGNNTKDDDPDVSARKLVRQLFTPDSPDAA